jgi:hypothetical protein
MIPQLFGPSLPDVVNWIHQFLAAVKRGDVDLSGAAGGLVLRSGDIILSYKVEVPEGMLSVEGQTLAVADYPSLYEVFGRDFTDVGVDADHFTLPPGPVAPLKWLVAI